MRYALVKEIKRDGKIFRNEDYYDEFIPLLRSLKAIRICDNTTRCEIIDENTDEIIVCLDGDTSLYVSKNIANYFLADCL